MIHKAPYIKLTIEQSELRYIKFSGSVSGSCSTRFSGSPPFSKPFFF